MSQPNGFQPFRLNPKISRALEELQFTAPTPIQEKALPLLLGGRDLIGRSQTGSGKTLAFLLPALHLLQTDTEILQSLILCPTRELADQVAREARRLGRHYNNFRVVSLVGGQPFGPQARGLKNAHLAVGTPGRVLDHLKRKTLSLSQISYLVLDEADRMLEMGFQEDMEEILRFAPSSRQTALFSATFPDEIGGLCQHYLKNPARVEIEATAQKAPDIAHCYLETPARKLDQLKACLAKECPESAIIFCNLKATVAEVNEELEQDGISVTCLHGDLDQTDRDRVMALFRNGSVKILVATDVAARGIDVTGLDLVINYDIPKPDIYVHRSGRTGRAGKAGKAVSIGELRDKYKADLIEKETGIRLIRVAPYPDIDSVPASSPVRWAKMRTLYIGGGRKDKLRPGDLLGAITGEAGGIPAEYVGKIEIHDRFAYMAVKAEIAGKALESLRNGKIKGRKFRVEVVNTQAQ